MGFAMASGYIVWQCMTDTQENRVSVERCFMCGGIHCGEVEGLVSVERWSCSRGASCVVEDTVGRFRDWSL